MASFRSPRSLSHPSRLVVSVGRCPTVRSRASRSSVASRGECASKHRRRRSLCPQVLSRVRSVYLLSNNRFRTRSISAMNPRCGEHLILLPMGEGQGSSSLYLVPDGQLGALVANFTESIPSFRGSSVAIHTQSFRHFRFYPPLMTFLSDFRYSLQHFSSLLLFPLLLRTLTSVYPTKAHLAVLILSQSPSRPSIIPPSSISKIRSIIQPC